MNTYDAMYERESNTRSKYAMSFGYMESIIKMAANGVLNTNDLKKELDNINKLWVFVNDNNKKPSQFYEVVRR